MSATAHGTFRLDVRGLVDVLSQHLYPTPDVYVRELLQNAVDAVTARRLAQPQHRGSVDLEVHEPAGGPPSLTVSDDGIGLTPTELADLLATIGRSSKRGGSHGLTGRGDFIGRFGIGLLSCLLVADEICVITRSAVLDDAPALQWRGRSDGTYDTTVLDAPLSAGTRVHITARRGAEFRVTGDQVLRLARHYGGLSPVPVRFVDQHGVAHPVNPEPPPWLVPAQSPDQQRSAALEYGRKTFGFDPLDVIPLHADGIHGYAYVLPEAPSPAVRQSHRVYLRRMLLTESADRLLPDWAYFVRCVVNADNLRPTAARDGFREDELLAAVRANLGRAVRDHLIGLARTEPDRLLAIVRTHGDGITALALHDDECLRLFINWLIVETSVGRMSLGEHLARYPQLRYVRLVDDFRQVAAIAAAQGQCVVNAGYHNVADVLHRLATLRPELDIAELDAAAIVDTFSEPSLAVRDEVHNLLLIADRALQPFGCAVDVRTFAPPGLPAVYVIDETGRFRREPDRIRELVATERGASPWGGVPGSVSASLVRVPTSRLCLNHANPAVRALATTAGRVDRHDRVRRAVQLLYIQSLLLGHHPLREPELDLFNETVLFFVDEPLVPAEEPTAR